MCGPDVLRCAVLCTGYEHGTGTERDSKQAFEWLEVAAHNNFTKAQYEAGRYADNGIGGVPKDEKKAFFWYSLAAENGHANAQNCLGVMYESGIGVQKDDQKVIEDRQMCVHF
jgi:TPR repeat protein